eukprot:scaffold93730_cov18-Tisochrysis_lutea.AAC.1
MSPLFSQVAETTCFGENLCPTNERAFHTGAEVGATRQVFSPRSYRPQWSVRLDTLVTLVEKPCKHDLRRKATRKRGAVHHILTHLIGRGRGAIWCCNGAASALIGANVTQHTVLHPSSRQRVSSPRARFGFAAGGNVCRNRLSVKQKSEPQKSSRPGQAA